ncbi:GTP cyclohydrolase FolE2 [Desulfovibrio litoralis]|uniref:GTP cyclohydrolase FolE2 n=1 Tax=Desulfovibrio litoralis DSM 11393 TaxID=1121455 RepID=A0A1M7TGB9_9BACT|nr:GTP cyclohydrolase FolE2 [Desulfovibrio litoralis]SHN69658.1 GTP cyclohydrolase I [Desulfovibrio litoralis DSM 11393]
MQDIQNSPSSVPIAIDRVGIKSLRVPIWIKDRSKGRQHSVATINLGADLPACKKGTHMSRLVEVIENWEEELDYSTLKKLLENIQQRLQAHKAYVSFMFPYFMSKLAPATQISGLMGYDCVLTGELTEHKKPVFTLTVIVPVMTVCPCSKAISDEGAHSQRALATVSVKQKGFAWIEEFIEIIESSASSQVYSILKRADEKTVTENAFASPCFVEDVVRNIALKLAEHKHVSWYKVEVESFESIHAHNAYAYIESENLSE